MMFYLIQTTLWCVVWIFTSFDFTLFDLLYLPIGLFLFDILEWSTHRIFHLRFKKIHAVHHRGNKLGIMSITETLTHFFCVFVAFVPSLQLLIVLLPAIVVMSWYVHIFPSSRLSLGHQKHHKNSTVNFSYFGITDRLLKTYSKAN